MTTKNLNLDYRKFINILHRNGYKKVRSKGSHIIFKNDNGNIITIKNKLNQMIARRLIKENDLH